MPEETQSTLSVVSQDDCPFALIGHALNTKGSIERWVTPSYASPLAFYIVMQRKSISNFLAPGMVGGAIGGALVGFFGTGGTVARTCSVSDLPITVRSAIDPSGGHASHEVVVVPKQAIDSVKYVGFWVFAVSVDLTVGKQTLSLATSVFSGTRIRRELARLGWLPGA